MTKNNDSVLTKKDVRDIVVEIVSDATDKILKGVDKMFSEHGKRIDSVENRLGNVENRLEKVETEIIFARRDIQDIKHNYVDQVQFNKLKMKVDRRLSAQ